MRDFNKKIIAEVLKKSCRKQKKRAQCKLNTSWYVRSLMSPLRIAELPVLLLPEKVSIVKSLGYNICRTNLAVLLEKRKVELQEKSLLSALVRNFGVSGFRSRNPIQIYWSCKKNHAETLNLSIDKMIGEIWLAAVWEKNEWELKTKLSALSARFGPLIFQCNEPKPKLSFKMLPAQASQKNLERKQAVYLLKSVFVCHKKLWKM